MGNEEAIWEIIKDIFGYLKYLTLSKEAKIIANFNLIKNKYWFEQLVNNQPSILKLIEEDDDIREYFASRKNVRSLLSSKKDRQHFKNLLNQKIN
ncbi:hypothetical protein [Falsibacillus pallidus]|uniref:Uncharacterized protein n=1 Tax=Falsibacillus pallidus TaxID=493781 RepID=A0A370GIL8_9BACI|nr:hypothetical protein [Falsibacillus pallidus]RDI42224.1 hypothetical protein DFR59_10563 [Falsibacillus pallidus]